MDVLIDGVNLKENFGLKLLAVHYGSPEQKEDIIDIPGMNGSLDLSEVITGFPVYKNVQHTLKFDFKDGTYEQWMETASHLKGKFHGRKLPVIVGNKNYYFLAKISIDTDKINQDYSGIEMILDAYPYRISNHTSMEPYLWDTFNFEQDVVYDLTNISVPADVTIIGAPMPTGCVIHCSQALTMIYNGIRYELPKGSSTSDDFIIFPGKENVFSFVGEGTVSIEYRWGIF